MRFGLYLSLQHPAQRSPREIVRERLELVALIRELGFDSVVCGQHFLVPSDVLMLQPVPMLARIVAEAGPMQIGTSVLIATLLNPVELVEQALTLAAMTEQPFMLGLGAGYRPEEDAAFGVPAGRIRHYTEKLEVIRKLVVGEPVTVDHGGYRLEQATITMPLDPRPELHIAATTAAGVRRAARFGDTWVAGTTVPLAEIEALTRLFVDEHGGPPSEFPAIRDVVVRATDEQAREVASAFLNPAPPPAGSSAAFVAEVDTEGAYLIGSPQTVIERLRAHERAGINHTIFRPQRPGVSLAQARTTLEILAAEVMPALR
jgi:alkanesulfonate monooxygenase SsuD/methylene tetrahydromethanopterin reductase-like flavin-dependent oxidoreductase (luciferase family)